MAEKTLEIGIIGLGKFGLRMATTLASMGHTVIGIDMSDARVQLAEELLDTVYKADATSLSVLRSLHVQDCAMTPEALAELVSIVDKGLISAKIANDIFADLMENGAMPEAYVKEKGLVQISDSSALEAAVGKVLADNPAEVEAFRGGKTKLISFFVGQVMRATRGKANPALVNELLAKKLAG